MIPVICVAARILNRVPEAAAVQDEPAQDPLPRLERPSREHALRFARILFERGERVDMQALAAGLGVGRTTLYRWVGDREELIATVLGELTDEVWTVVAEQADGEGLDRAFDTIRRFMDTTSAWEPLRRFAQREPALALRILTSPRGLVQDRIRAGVRDALVRNLPPATAVAPEVIEVLVHVGAALEWTPIVIGEQPEIERALHLGRTVLVANLRG
jgi:AcrR family transcriptional regulator